MILDGEHIVPFFLCHSLLLGCFILQRQIRLGIVYRPIKFEINNWNDFQYYHWNTLYFYCSICVYTNALTEKSKCLHIFTRVYAQTHVNKISVCKGSQSVLFVAIVRQSVSFVCNRLLYIATKMVRWVSNHVPAV